MEEKFNKKDSEINLKFYKRKLYPLTKKNYATNKTDIYHFDDIWSLDILDLEDYGPENIRSYRYVLIVVDIFNKIGWTIPLKNKKTQTIKILSKILLLVQKKNRI